MSSLLQPARSDEQLTGAIATGDHYAFEELYRRYARPLAAYGARVLRDRSRGEDVAQTALARAYEALQRGTEPLRVKPWLYKIALNTALEQRARDGEVLDGESDEHEDVTQEASAQRADILAAVQVLPERQRMVFFLREVQGLSVGDVAQRLGLDNQQVEQALFAARNRLAEELVFGGRVDCNLVRSLDAQSLTRFERRALKGHMRGCPSCRHNAGFGFTSIGFWARDAWQWLVGSGGGVAVSAAKVGALAMTATAIGTAPVTVPAIAHKLIHHARASLTSRPDLPAQGQPPMALRQLDRLRALFVPPFARKLAPPFEAPEPAPLVPADPMAEVPVADPSLVEPSADQPSVAGADSAQLDPQPGDQPVADQTPTDSTPTPTDSQPVAGDSTATDETTTDSSADSTSADATASDGGTDSPPTDPSATDTSTVDTTATDATASDTTPTP
jgi:RNA polymerase sigma-70 factor (ECF subfamily)